MIDYDDGEANLLNFYGLSTIHPTELADLNISSQDPIDVDDEKIKSLTVDEQFQMLNSLVKENHIDQSYHNDVEDPFRGGNTNVVKELIDNRIISSENDPDVNKYLISSREFNSTKFLTTIHKDTPIEQLVEYLKFLQKNIESQQGELKYVINDNFLKFIDCKDSIDEILGNFKKSKTRAQQELENARVFNPSRVKNLEKDNKFLISGLEDSIKNLTTATSILIRPIMDNENKELKISRIIEFVKTNKILFDLPSKLMAAVTNQNHEEIIDSLTLYSKHKRTIIEEQKFKLNNLKQQTRDEKKHQELKDYHKSVNTLLNRIFNQVDNIIEVYKKSIYNELLSFDNDLGKGHRSNNAKFLSIVDKIDQLNFNELVKSDQKHISPINTFLKTQLKKSNDDLFYQFNKFEEKFQILQNKIVNYIESLKDYKVNGSYVNYIEEKYNNIENYFKASSSIKFKKPNLQELELIINETFDSNDNLDLSLINETWLVFLNFINYLNDIYLKNLNKFVDNYNYYIKNNAQIDINGDIRNLFLNTIIQISDKLFNIFQNSQETNNQLESSPTQYNNILPHYTNSLSTIYYITRINNRLNKIFTHFGKNVMTIGNIGKTTETNKIIKNLRTISSSINQKILESTCSVWVNDCSQFYDLENWEIDEKIISNDVELTNTKLVNIIEFYMIYMLKQIKSLVFIDLEEESNVKIVSTYPSKKMLVSIEIQFMRCLSIIIDSIMKKYNLEQQKSQESNFKILTMNNIDKILRDIYPNLLKNYDAKFEKDLSQQNLKIFTDIDKVNFTILEDVLNKEKTIVDEILTGFFNKIIHGSITTEFKVDNFIYEILTHFVKLVYNLKPITNQEFFIKIINELQDFFLKNFLDYFRKLNTSVENFDVILVNLKLDINFFIEIFEPSKTLKLNEYCFNIADIILNSIKQENDPIISDKKFDNILIQCLKDSDSQFDCLGR
ncbi:exocyst complex component Sec5p [[Candida] jaroonii]|uniref:Exocyst complex component Sec5p n=1 Tax=[Candida] jaroonii TaxID=467808 RepID=A0ACA9Y2Y4_9ASCO|nr:exocyst complex component Sec5p [[Candida] jaroonii]